MIIPMFESNLQNKCETNKNYYVCFANTVVLHVYFEDNGKADELIQQAFIYKETPT